MEERIMTLHPQGKTGVNITRERYDTVREKILCSLNDHGDMTFKELTKGVKHRLEGRFDGSVTWYVTTVKLDLEARGTIERIPQETPQRLRLTQPV